MFKETLRSVLPPKIFYYLVEIKNFFFPSSAYLKNKKQFKESLDFFAQFIKSGDLVFDIGANYGNKTKVFIRLNARVVAIEPQQECVRFLKSIYGNRIKVVAKGIADKEGVLDFYIAESSTLSTFSHNWIEDVIKNRDNSNVSDKVLKMPVITIDKLIEEFGMPAFIKIDVEGFELEALRGLTYKTNYLSFEYAVPENYNSVIKCIEKITQIGKVEINYSAGESMKFGLEEWMLPEKFLRFVHSSEFNSTSAGDIYIRFT